MVRESKAQLRDLGMDNLEERIDGVWLKYCYVDKELLSYLLFQRKQIGPTRRHSKEAGFLEKWICVRTSLDHRGGGFIK